MENTKKIFVYSFAFIIVIRAIALCEFRKYVPYTELYIIYIGIWGMLLLWDSRFTFSIKKNKVTAAILFLALYDIFFAFSNIPVLDQKDVLSTMLRSMMMVAFVVVSSYWIRRLGCLKQTIHMAYIFFAIFMTILFILYLDEIHLISTLSTFWQHRGAMRSRTRFGFIVNNVAAEHAFSVILMSFYVLNDCKFIKDSSLKKTLIYVDDIIMFLLILANNSRGTLLAAVLMLFIYAYIRHTKRKGIKRIIEFAVFIAVFSGIAIMMYVKITDTDLATLLYPTNRMHFIANYKILAHSGRWLLGLGRTSGTYLANRNILYGMRTDYMEIFYAGVFIQTGIIGSIWIGLTLYLIGKSVYIKVRKNPLFIGKWIYVIFIYTLLMSCFEDYALTSLYITSTFFLVFIVAFCDRPLETAL